MKKPTIILLSTILTLMISISAASALTQGELKYSFKQALFEQLQERSTAQEPILEKQEALTLSNYLKDKRSTKDNEVVPDNSVAVIYEKAQKNIKKRLSALIETCTPGYVCEDGVSKYRMANCDFDTRTIQKCEYGCLDSKHCAPKPTKHITCEEEYGQEYHCALQGQEQNIYCPSRQFQRIPAPHGCYQNGDPTPGEAECVKCLHHEEAIDCFSLGSEYRCVSSREFENMCKKGGEMHKKEFVKAPNGCKEDGVVIQDSYAYCARCTNQVQEPEIISCDKIYGRQFKCVAHHDIMGYCGEAERVIHYADIGCSDAYDTLIETAGYCVYCLSNQTNQTDSNCIDTDGGRKPYIFGVVSGRPSSQYNQTKAQDYCYSGKIQREFYLYDDCLIGSTYNECTYGCQNGRCLYESDINVSYNNTANNLTNQTSINATINHTTNNLTG